jgi:hypothetical protein
MTRKSAANLPAVSGIDLQFRPRSYFWPLSTETHLLSRIKGAERKAALQRLIDAGRIGAVPDFLVTSALSEADRTAAGRFHPAFMGGEYLPDMGREEVIILRATIASVTQDVTCVYARRGRNRIYYRVVDEYGGDTLGEKRTRTSTRPLTLGELEAFFNGAWSIFDVLAGNDYECDLEQSLGFVEGVESEFYPDLDRLYRQRITALVEEQRRLHGPDDEPALVA